MLSSMHRRDRRQSAPAVFVTLAVALLVSTVPAVLSAPAPAFAAVPARCGAPVAGAEISQIPWPQQRYAYGAVGQITTGAGVVVAVIDSGVDAAGPQLSGAVLPGADLLEPGGTGREDCPAHGTAVASIIAARPTLGSGLRGLAPATTIFPVRVSERVADSAAPAGSGDIGDLAAGIRAATASRPRPAVINLSISTGTDDPALRSAIRAAIDADIVVIAAVGNDHDHGDPVPYPASYDGVVGVGAIGPDSARIASSQVGSYVDIVAPGTQVVGALPGGGNAAFEGTSFAAPFVSATAALIRARWPQLHQADVVRRLLATADPAADARPSPAYGYGVLNPLRALTELLPATPTPAAVAALPPAATPPTAPRPSATPTLIAATILVLTAALIMVIAAAFPAARRRSFRPTPVPRSRS